jgi:hypothetical protein
VSPEQRVPQDHPLRAIRTLVDGVLRASPLARIDPLLLARSDPG